MARRMLATVLAVCLLVTGALGARAPFADLGGYPDGTFGGGRTLTRAEAAAVAVRARQAAADAGPVPVWVASSWHVATVPMPTWDRVSVAAAPDGALYVRQGAAVSRLDADGRLAPDRTLGAAAGHWAAGPGGSLYRVGDGPRMLRVRPDGAEELLAGGPEPAFADGPGAAARFTDITGLCADGAGYVYVMEQGEGGHNGRLRKIDPQGRVTTHAGLTPAQYTDLHRRYGGPGGAVTEGPGYLASLGDGGPIACDAAGNVYLAFQRIRRVTRDGHVYTVAGGAWEPAGAVHRRRSGGPQ